MGRGRIAESEVLEAVVPGRRTPLNADPLRRSSDNAVSEGPLLADLCLFAYLNLMLLNVRRGRKRTIKARPNLTLSVRSDADHYS